MRSYFEQVFGASGEVANLESIIQKLRPIVDENMKAELIRPFEMEEFKEAVFQMHPDKAPRPMDSTRHFFRNSG